MTAEKTGKNGPSLAVPAEEEEERRRRGRAAVGSPFGNEESRARPAAPAAADPFAEARGAAGQPSEFSDAVAIQIPSQTPAGARKPYFIFGDGRTRSICGSSIWRAQVPFSSPVRGARTSLPTTRAIHRSRELRPGRMVGHLQAAASRAPAPRSPRRVPADGFLRLGRGRARAWQQAGSHGLVIDLCRAGVVPSAVGPMVQTALLILASNWPRLAWCGGDTALALAGEGGGGGWGEGGGGGGRARRRRELSRHPREREGLRVFGESRQSFTFPSITRLLQPRDCLRLELGKAFSAKLVGCHVYAAKLHDYRFRQMEYTLPRSTSTRWSWNASGNSTTASSRWA